MFIDKDGDVEGNYTLLSLQNDPMEFKTGKSLQPVGYFTIVNKDIPVSIYRCVFPPKIIRFFMSNNERSSDWTGFQTASAGDLGSVRLCQNQTTHFAKGNNSQRNSSG